LGLSCTATNLPQKLQIVLKWDCVTGFVSFLATQVSYEGKEEFAEIHPSSCDRELQWNNFLSYKVNLLGER
jgi:hypothetical protein